MKNLKNILSIILVAVIMLTATSTMAYSGTVDAQDDISISTIITNGKGSIDIARGVAGYKLYYQANELNNDTYKQIKQLKDELRVIQAFNIYEATQSDSDYNEYASTQMYYKNLYGKNVDDCSEQKVNEDMSIIISLLPEYTESWKQTKDNSFDIDLSSFAGTKDFVVWVQLVKQDGTKAYDAEVFELTGTKKDTTNNNGNSGSNNNGSSNNGNNGSNNNGSSNSGNNGSNNNGSSNSGNNGSNNNGSNNNGSNNNGSSNSGNNGSNSNGSSNNGNNGSNNNGSSNSGNNGSNNNGSSNNGNNGSNNSGNSGTNNNGSSNNGTSTDVKNAGKDTSTKSSSSTGDKTTSSSKLPYAGMAKGTTIVAILVAIAGTVISYIKYRKLN